MAEKVNNNDLDDDGNDEFFNLYNHTKNDLNVTDVVKKEDHYFDYCDESKCVSSLLLGRTGEDGNNNNNNNNKVPTFTCYAEGNEMSPFACAEGYKGFVVENEPLFLYEDKHLSYYTCCLPPPTPALHSSSSQSSSSLSSVTLPYQRHCSNTIVIGNNEEKEQQGGEDRGDMNLCDGGTRTGTDEFDSTLEKKYPRNMTRNFGHLESYTCCDELLLPLLLSSNNNNSSTVSKFPFLDDVDCVPYLCIDVFDYDCISKNRYGALVTMTCRDDLYNGIFVFPKIVATNDNEIRFECCKAGIDTHILPKNTHAFRKTYCVQLVLSSITLVSLLILIMSLLRPFVMNMLKYKTEDVSSATSRSSSTLISNGRSSTSLRRSSVSRSSASRRSSSSLVSASRSTRQQPQQHQYSPYNLYLVFIALPDIVISMFIIWRCSSALTGQIFDNKWAILDWNGTTDIARYSGAILWTCSTANVCMNAVIAFEVLKFLKNSFKLIRDPQPSLLKVSLQASFVYVYAIVLNLILFSFYSKYRESPEMYYVMTIGYPLLLLFTIIGPFIFLIVICFIIWKRGYISRTDKRYKYLAIYFLRIVVAFIILWVPTTIIAMIHLIPVQTGYADGLVFTMYTYESVLPLYAISMIMISLQALLSVVMAVLKPDVQKMVTDLFTGCCCYHDKLNDIKGSSNSNKITSEPTQELEHSMPIHNEENVDDTAKTTHDLDPQMPQIDDSNNDQQNQI